MHLRPWSQNLAIGTSEDEAQHVRLVRQGNAVTLGNRAQHSVAAFRRIDAMRMLTPNLSIEHIEELLVKAATTLRAATNMTLEEEYAM